MFDQRVYVTLKLKANITGDGKGFVIFPEEGSPQNDLASMLILLSVFHFLHILLCHVTLICFLFTFSLKNVILEAKTEIKSKKVLYTLLSGKKYNCLDSQFTALNKAYTN